MNGNEPQKPADVKPPAAQAPDAPQAAQPQPQPSQPAQPVSVDPHATDRPSVDVPPLQAPGRTDIEIKAMEQREKSITPEQRRELNQEALELARDQVREHGRGFSRGRGLGR